MTETSAASTPAPAGIFATTRWSVVAAAGTNDREGRAALASLCETYWFPVYTFARRRGRSVDDARDLVQGFFTRLLERDDFANADAERGRFRSWLLAAFVHFEANEYHRANAVKRGGGRVGFSLDEAVAEERFAHEPATEEDPARAFERSWARTLLEEVVVRLRTEYEEGGRGEVFEQLKPILTGEELDGGYRGIAEDLGTTEGAVKVAAHRLRKRFGELLRREIADTVAGSDDVEAEIQGLFEALGD